MKRYHHAMCRQCKWQSINRDTQALAEQAGTNHFFTKDGHYIHLFYSTQKIEEKTDEV